MTAPLSILLPPPPGPLPRIEHSIRADAKHYMPWPGAHPRPILYAVLHNSEGQDSRAWLSTTSPPNDPVSIHTLADRDGVLWEIVSPADIAWHVGTGDGVIKNGNSVGLELDNLSSILKKTAEPYPDAQLAAAGYRLATWAFSYALGPAQIVRHSDIARPVGRRADPSALPGALWDWLHRWMAFFTALPPEQHAAWIL